MNKSRKLLHILNEAKEIYRIPGANKITAKQAAEEFARKYWDKPRKVVMMKVKPKSSGIVATFKVEGGVNTYEIGLSKDYYGVYAYTIYR